jgi:hypothetical protein
VAFWGSVCSIMGFLYLFLPSHPSASPQPSLLAGSRDIKQEIRTLLETINPEILRRVDLGSNRINVMIGQIHATQLASLSSQERFSKYLEFKQTGGTMMASHNVRLGDYLNDETESSMMVGHTLYPKDALKK